MIILARLYPREMDCLFVEDIWEGIEELCLIGKVELYSVRDRRFEYDLLGNFPNWGEHQRVRDSKTKLPQPGEFDKELNDWALRRAMPLDLKIAVAKRDSCKCQMCGKNLNPFNLDAKRLIKLKNGTLHFDHTIPVKYGGRATIENVRLLCPNCNLSRPRTYTYDDIIKYLCGNPQESAASCGELPPNPIQSNQSNPIESNPISEPNGFNDWMKHYPKQSGKAKARTYWLKLIDSKKWTAEQLITCADNYSALVKREGREQRFIKQADGFLNPANGIFEDYLSSGQKEPSTHIPYKSPREQLFGEDA